MRPWNDWYHCTLHTYGTWLRGDLRGWRSRHHREHVDGDYKHPPPKGKYDALFEYSKSLMKRDAVRIERQLRDFVLDALVDKLFEKQIPVAVGSLDGIHGTSSCSAPSTSRATGSDSRRRTRPISSVS